MDTLIELYDERAIENILAPDMFRPQRIIYLCPGEIAQDRKRQEKLKAFFRRRGWTPELIFMETSLFKADRILRQLLAIGEKYPDCALDAMPHYLPRVCSLLRQAPLHSPTPEKRIVSTTSRAPVLPMTCTVTSPIP